MDLTPNVQLLHSHHPHRPIPSRGLLQQTDSVRAFPVVNQEIINCTFLRCPSTRRPRMPRLRSRQEVKRSERLGFVVVPSARASSAAISEREDQAAPPLSRFVLASRRVITFVHRMRGAISKHPNLISVPAEGWNHPPSHGSKSPVELSSFPWLSARLLLHPSSKRATGNTDHLAS